MTQLPENHRINQHLRHLERMARERESVISRILQLTELLMSGQAEAAAELALLRQAIADDQASDQAVVDKLDAALEQAKADGDTTNLIAAIQEAKAAITGVTSKNV